MFELLWLVPGLPFAGFLILAIFGKRMGQTATAITGVGSVGLSALLTLIIGITFITSPPAGNSFDIILWEWFNIGGFNPSIAFHLDSLSLVFMFVVSFVGFLIHLYSAEFMIDDEGFSPFFAYMNLFVGSMLTLVLADNFLLLYLGWEGVGLCSYLLIGFWYKDPVNSAAAIKAFIVTRIGDTAMIIGLFILVMSFGTLNIQSILSTATGIWTAGSSTAVAVAFLLLGGALGKSAQLPLQTWLPDAMAGPSPVSALIHAATMVTAGVYLIARTNVIFTLAPVVLNLVAIIGALTLLIAGFSALTQFDIKRVLAYSTISQIGYMFLALGVGAWSAAIFHFMIHAFFKALLFLGAGAVIISVHHEHNMYKMGGLRKELPVTFWTFLIASASLAAFPLVTAGFYSKDAILWFAWSSTTNGSEILWAAGWIGAFITAIYTFRMVFLTFYGNKRSEVSHKPGWLIKIPLIILAVFALIGGFIELPDTLGHVTIFSSFLDLTLPAVKTIEGSVSELTLQIIVAITAFLGIYIAYRLYIKIPVSEAEDIKQSLIRKFLFSGWGFDWLYDKIFIRPVVFFAKINKNDFIDYIYTFIAWLNRMFNQMFAMTQTGKVRWYAMGIVLGAIITLTIAAFL